MPEEAYSYAVADWHYNHNDPRCPHDGWVESLLVEELASGTRAEYRDLEIRVRLLGAHHDGQIEMTYRGVQSYLLEAPRKLVDPTRPGKGHENWMIDEVRLSEPGYVVHEVEFSSGGSWWIECEDLIYRWRPFGKRQGAP